MTQLPRPNGVELCFFIFMAESEIILDQSAIESILAKMAKEISDSYPSPDGLAIIGIQRGGALPAQRLQELLERAWGKPALFGKLDVTMHRDDLDNRAPQMSPTEILFDLTDLTVILVDDVLFRGRTIRAALDALHILGRPRKVELAALLDIGGRELPIKADYVGRALRVAADHKVRFRFKEDGFPEDLALAEFMGNP